jgi:hypothetical protein
VSFVKIEFINRHPNKAMPMKFVQGKYGPEEPPRRIIAQKQKAL